MEDFQSNILISFKDSDFKHGQNQQLDGADLTKNSTECDQDGSSCEVRGQHTTEENKVKVQYIKLCQKSKVYMLGTHKNIVKTASYIKLPKKDVGSDYLCYHGTC